MWRQGFLDGHPSQLVPKRDAVRDRLEHACGQALVQPGRHLPDHAFEQPELRSGRHDRHGLQHGDSGVRKPRDAREHRVAHHGRDGRPRCGRHFGHEERVAAGGTVQPVGVNPGRRGHDTHGLAGERLGGEPAHRARGTELAEQATQWMGPFELVIAIRRNNERRNHLNASAEDTDHIQRRLVGPMEILQDPDRARLALRLTVQPRGDLVRLAAMQKVDQVASTQCCDIEKRPHRSGCEQWVTASPEDGLRLRHLGAESSHERGLPAARLAPDQYQDTPGPRTAAAKASRNVARWSARSSSAGRCRMCIPARCHGRATGANDHEYLCHRWQLT